MSLSIKVPDLEQCFHFWIRKRERSRDEARAVDLKRVLDEVPSFP